MGDVVELPRFSIIDGPFGVDAIEVLDGPFDSSENSSIPYFKYRIKVRKNGVWEEKVLPASWIKAVWDRQNRVECFSL